MIEGAVQRLRPKLMTVAVVMVSLAPILWESGIGSDVMKPIAAPIVGGMITSTIHVLMLVPVFFAMIKDRALRQGKLQSPAGSGCVRVPSGTEGRLHPRPNKLRVFRGRARATRVVIGLFLASPTMHCALISNCLV